MSHKKLASQMLKCRLARLGDRSAILNTIPNLNEGVDRIEARYEELLQDPLKMLFVAELEGKVVSFLMHYIVDDQRRILVQSARVDQDVQHKGILSQLGKHAGLETVARFPRATELTWTSGNIEDTRQAMERNPEVNMVSTRRQTFFRTTPNHLQSEKFREACQWLGCDSVQVHPPGGALDVLEKGGKWRDVVCPEGTWVINWEPLGHFLSNHKRIAQDSFVATSSGDGRGINAISFGTKAVYTSLSKSLLKYHIDFYGDVANVGGRRVMNAHLRSHLRVLGSVLNRNPVTDVRVGVTAMRDTPMAEINALVCDAMGLGCIEDDLPQTVMCLRRPLALWTRTSKY